MTMVGDFFTQGGPVLYVVLFAAIVLWTLIIERLWYYSREHRHLADTLIDRWNTRADRSSRQARQVRKAWLSRFRLRGDSSLIFISTLIAVCPLLGLLGTVTGMIQVFGTLAVTGTGNARAMAAGIGQATLPTMAGLVVALSGMYFRSRFQRISVRSEQALADQMPLGGH